MEKIENMEEKSVISTANEIVLQNTIGDELSLIRTFPNNLKSDGFQEILINSEILWTLRSKVKLKKLFGVPYSELTTVNDTNYTLIVGIKNQHSLEQKLAVNHN